MKNISTNIAYVPLRKNPAHAAEQTSQILLGETGTIYDEKEDWYYIKTSFDSYEGWIEKKVCVPVKDTTTKTVTSSFYTNVNKGFKTFIPHGAELTIIDDNQYLLPNGLILDITKKDHFAIRRINDYVTDFIGTPYLWGGRSVFGIDCSGLSQVIMKCLGIKLPRDASQQVNGGSEVPFVDQVKTGDLAFFENNEGNITHVGIVLNSKEIFHSSGYVRVDRLDQQGIFNETTKKYTHKLRVIKRFI